MTPFTTVPHEIEDAMERWSSPSRRDFLKTLRTARRERRRDRDGRCRFARRT